ncbi:MAG: hypothetical protein L0Y72_23575 [Gemmataceae bacterium]|nr:hypothetical protein [Gemmataceae bacterium]MCI0742025.1 hypothetical protein [Gemmataceae bacterium]
MAHQDSAGQCIDSALQGAVKPGVAEMVQAELWRQFTRLLQQKLALFGAASLGNDLHFAKPTHSQSQLDTLESTVDCVGGPGLSVTVAKQRTKRMLMHKPSHDPKRLLGQVAHAWPFFAFGLFGRKEEAGLREIDVSRFGRERFLGPRRRLPRENKQVLKLSTARNGNNLAERGGRNHHGSLARPRFFVVGQRIDFDVALSFGPPQRTHYGPGHSVFGAGRPIRSLLEPVIDVKMPELPNGELAADELAKQLQPPPIPFVRFSGPVFLAPFEVAVDNSDNGTSWQLHATSHQFVVFAKCFVTIGTEVRLLSLDLDLPNLPG